ncbi:SNF2-related domain-containing protein, partial [Reticulomyxa filosa]
NNNNNNNNTSAYYPYNDQMLSQHGRDFQGGRSQTGVPQQYEYPYMNAPRSGYVADVAPKQGEQKMEQEKERQRIVIHLDSEYDFLEEEEEEEEVYDRNGQNYSLQDRHEATKAGTSERGERMNEGDSRSANVSHSQHKKSNDNTEVVLKSFIQSKQLQPQPKQLQPKQLQSKQLQSKQLQPKQLQPQSQQLKPQSKSQQQSQAQPKQQMKPLPAQ